MPPYKRGMGFKKPFRTKPIVLGEYARSKKRRGAGLFAVKVLGGAGLAGVVLGSALGRRGLRAIPGAVGASRWRRALNILWNRFAEPSPLKI